MANFKFSFFDNCSLINKRIVRKPKFWFSVRGKSLISAAQNFQKSSFPYIYMFSNYMSACYEITTKKLNLQAKQTRERLHTAPSSLFHIPGC